MRGLFGGGTLADEAMLVAEPALGPIRSNIPLRPDLALPADSAGGLPALRGVGHAIVDLGDDAFTVGRPHPMIDPSTAAPVARRRRPPTPTCAVMLLDVVLGHAADPDPAAALAPAIRAAIDDAAARGRVLHVVISLCGTAGDPQDRQGQAERLRAAGASVYTSNASAARAAAALAGRAVVADAAAAAEPSTASGSPRRAAPPDVSASLLEPPAGVITAGIALFADALRDQAVPVTTVDVRPPAVVEADGSRRLRAALDAVLLDERRLAANADAATRMLAVRARLVDVRPARDALGLRPGEFCTPDRRSTGRARRARSAAR